MQEIMKHLPTHARINHVAEQRFAWPGGYALGLVLADGECICSACVVKHLSRIHTDTLEKCGGYRAIAAYVSDPDDDAGDWNDGFATLCVECERPITDSTNQE